MRVDFERLDSHAILPVRKFKSDAGWDLFSVASVVIAPRAHQYIPVGIRLIMPLDCDVFAWNATPSSLARRGLQVLGGIIDPGYGGDCGPVLYNLSDTAQSIACGDKVSQLIFLPRIEVIVDDEVEKHFVRKAKQWNGATSSVRTAH